MSTIVVTESQYNRLLVDSIRDSFKKIIVSESQYYRLICPTHTLKEQTSHDTNLGLARATGDAQGFLDWQAKKKSSGKWKGANISVPGTTNITIGKPANLNTGWSTKDGSKKLSLQDGKYRNPYFAVGGYGGDLVHISYFCGNYIKDGEVDIKGKSEIVARYYKSKYGLMGTQKNLPSKKMKKFVEMIWKLGASQFKGNPRYHPKLGRSIIRAGIDKYIEAIKSGKVKYYSTDSMGRKKKADNTHWFIKDEIKGLKSLRKAAEDYPWAGTCDTLVYDINVMGDFSESIGFTNFIKWINSWDEKDWLDALAVAALVVAVAFPPAALVAIPIAYAAEAANVVITANEFVDCYADPNCKSLEPGIELGLRVTCLVAGPIIGMALGGAIKLGWKGIVNVLDLGKKFFGLGSKTIGKKGAEVTIREATEWLAKQGVDEATKKATLEYIEKIAKNPKGVEGELKHIQKLIKAAQGGDESAIKKLQKMSNKGRNKMGSMVDKALEYFGQGVEGGFTKSQYVKDLLEIPSRWGMALGLTIFVTFEKYRFEDWMKNNNITKSQAKKVDLWAAELGQVAVKSKISEIKVKIAKKVRSMDNSLAGELGEGFQEYKYSGNLLYDLEFLSQHMEQEKFQKLVDFVNKSVAKRMDIFYEFYEKGKISIIEMPIDNAYKKYNEFCDGEYKSMGMVTTGTTYSKIQLDKIEKGYREYKKGDIEISIVTTGKFKGIYAKEKDNMKWMRVTGDCDISTPIVQNVCTNENYTRLPQHMKEFCNGVRFEKMQLEEFNEIIIETFVEESEDGMDRFRASAKKSNQYFRDRLMKKTDQ